MRVVWPLVVLVGCGWEDPDFSRFYPDAGPRAVTITTASFQPLSLFAIRETGGSWQRFPIVADETYAVSVFTPYEIVVVCGDATGYQTVVALATPTDGDRTVYCFAGNFETAAGPASTFRVTGEMQQPGTVILYDIDSSDSAPWGFGFNVPEGQQALFAYDNDRVFARRHLAVHAALSLGTVDLGAGRPFTRVPLTFEGKLDDETPSSELTMYSDDAVFSLTTPGTTARLLPPGYVEPADYSFMRGAVGSPTTFRQADVEDLTANPLRVYLPRRLENIQMTDSGATWSTLPSPEEVWYSVTTETGNTLRIEAGWRWLIGQSAFAADLDSIPAYDPQWKVDPNARHGYRFAVYSGGFSQVTEVRSPDLTLRRTTRTEERVLRDRKRRGVSSRRD